jgi:hypothetical protein
MKIYTKDLTVEVSGAGCVTPKVCWCCKKFGYHRCKITHNPSGIDAEIIQQIWEFIPWDNCAHLEEFISSIEDPRLLAFNFLKNKIEKKEFEEKNKHIYSVDTAIEPPKVYCSPIVGLGDENVTNEIQLKSTAFGKLEDICRVKGIKLK